MKKSTTKKVVATKPTPRMLLSQCRKAEKDLVAAGKKVPTYLAMFNKVVGSLTSQVSSLEKKLSRLTKA